MRLQSFAWVEAALDDVRNSRFIPADESGRATIGLTGLAAEIAT